MAKRKKPRKRSPKPRRTQLTEAGRRRADSIQRAMKRVAERRRCEACKRGNALSRNQLALGGGSYLVVKKCRYCGAERSFTVT